MVNVLFEEPGEVELLRSGGGGDPNGVTAQCMKADIFVFKGREKDKQEMS